MPKVSSIRLTKRLIEAAPPGSYLWDSEVRGFGLRVTPAGTRSFLYRYKVTSDAPGEHLKRQRYEPIGRFPSLTVEEAREVAKVLAGKRDTDHRGVREQDMERRKRAKTVADLESLYLGEYARTRGLRHNTIAASKAGFGHIPDGVKCMAIDAVTKPDIRRLHADVKERVGHYAANRLLALLSKAFALGEEQGWLTTPNPCRGIKKYTEDQRHRNLTEQEVARLLDACDRYAGLDPATAQNAADAIRLLLFTGARLQEVLRAEWSMFDLERGRWTKPSAHTKTSQQHFLQIEGPGLDLLKAMRERDPEGVYLFAGKPTAAPNGTTAARPRADLKRPWEEIRKDAGLEDVRLHDLRRTTASFMLSSGATIAAVGKALGHTQSSTTDRYAHLASSVQGEGLRRAGERMAALRGTSSKADIVRLPAKS